MTSLLALVVLLVAGLPLAFAMTRALPLAIVLAPVAGAATSTAAVLLMLAFRGPLLGWFVPVFLLTGLLAWWWRDRPPVRHGTWRDALLMTVPLIPPFLYLLQQPLVWDTHLIWWLHAGYFTHGGDFARASIGNPALVFSHPDYPPLASAPVALVWQVLDLRAFYPAAAVSGALTFSAIAMMVHAVRLVTSGQTRSPRLTPLSQELKPLSQGLKPLSQGLTPLSQGLKPLSQGPSARGRARLRLNGFAARARGRARLRLNGFAASAHDVVSWPVAIAVGYAAWSPLWWVPTAGFSDAMCATAFTAGAVLLLFGRDPFGGRILPLALLLLAASALMKNEGLSMVVALAIVVTVRHRRHLRHAAWAWLPVAVAGIWSVTARALGAQTDVLAGGRFGALLHGDRGTLDRFPLIFSTMAGRVGWIMVYALAAAVVGAVFLRHRRRRLGLGADPWLWAVAALHWSGLTLIYLVTPYDIHWHLSTSVDRVMISITVLSCASAACWAVVALAPAEDQHPAAPAEAAGPKPDEIKVGTPP